MTIRKITNDYRLVRLLEQLACNLQRIADATTCANQYTYRLATIQDKAKLEKELDECADRMYEYTKKKCDDIHRLAEGIIDRLNKESS